MIVDAPSGAKDSQTAASMAASDHSVAGEQDDVTESESFEKEETDVLLSRSDTSPNIATGTTMADSSTSLDQLDQPDFLQEYTPLIPEGLFAFDLMQEPIQPILPMPEGYLPPPPLPPPPSLSPIPCSLTMDPFDFAWCSKSLTGNVGISSEQALFQLDNFLQGFSEGTSTHHPTIEPRAAATYPAEPDSQVDPITTSTLDDPLPTGNDDVMVLNLAVAQLTDCPRVSIHDSSIRITSRVSLPSDVSKPDSQVAPIAASTLDDPLPNDDVMVPNPAVAQLTNCPRVSVHDSSIQITSRVSLPSDGIGMVQSGSIPSTNACFNAPASETLIAGRSKRARVESRRNEIANSIGTENVGPKKKQKKART
jgi:hypothetical protein